VSEKPGLLQFLMELGLPVDMHSPWHRAESLDRSLPFLGESPYDLLLRSN